MKRRTDFDLDKALEQVNAGDFMDRALAATSEGSMHVLRVAEAPLLVTYENASTRESTRIFVRDPGVIARDLPGEGPTKYRLQAIEPAPAGFLEWYAAGRCWPDVLRKYYAPEPWEPILWGWEAKALDSLQAGALVLRLIGKATCKACGQPRNAMALSMLDRRICGDCADQRREADPRVRASDFLHGAAERGRVTGRNELCPCGSGQKFKRCCGR